MDDPNYRRFVVRQVAWDGRTYHTQVYGLSGPQREPTGNNVADGGDREGSTRRDGGTR